MIPPRAASRACLEPSRLTLTILYFAALRELLGVTEERVEVPASAGSIAELAVELARRHPHLEPHLGSVRFAVNEVFVASSAPLKSGDVVALIPPVSGG
jgi:molybdopterin converting factor subunit 1